MNKSRGQGQSLGALLLAYLFAGWHMRGMPRDTQEQRRRRAVWARDHGARFAGRWFIIALLSWMIQMSPLGYLFTVAGIPLLAILFLMALLLGVGHLALQIVAQKRAGPPRIDPPEDWPDDEDPRN
ncbi:MAG: hypothetical protein JJT90_05980 [Ectothiorhodospiraceae bacterium]|nr:hypothetical protein [Ectothiorhodospiraceae bacterium]